MTNLSADKRKLKEKTKGEGVSQIIQEYPLPQRFSCQIIMIIRWEGAEGIVSYLHTVRLAEF